MYLSKLEIQGFKSFANKTVVKFTRGITGIVGPNGCGKTNIVDAIRWALGEQKSSTLRSDKMENVIFNGTRQKKPMGMAEVSLTMENDRGTLPTDYSEVTITRRIFRSGESEYLLNRNVCRLKDITNLFMDTGMGANAYSVIELKMVETILSSKADERRRMFEEAAGVNKYKLRRKHSLKKLEEVKSDLTRVNDIVSEVEKSVSSLQRQAKKADKYNNINSVLREKEIYLSEHEFARYHSRKSKLNEEKSQLNERKEVVDSEIKKIENELIVYREKISNIESELNSKRNEISEQNEKIHELQRNLSVSKERLKSLESNISRYKQEVGEFKSQKEQTEDNIVEYQDELYDIEQKIEQKRKEIEESANIKEEKKQEVEEKRSVLKSENDSVLTQIKTLNAKENELENLRKAKQQTDKQIENLNGKIQKITNNIAKTVGYLEDLTNEKEEAEKKLKESEKEYSQKQEEKDKLEKKLSELKNQELEQKSTLNGLKNKIDFLQTLITNLEGVSKGSKVLIESEGWADKDKTLFADVGSAKDEYRSALEAALKNVLNNLLIENIEDLRKAIDYLKKNDLGKASFYLLEKPDNDKIPLLEFVSKFGLKRKIKALENSSNFIAWAESLIETTPKWKPYFKKVLFKTAITKDLDSAVHLHKKFPNFDFATLDGDFIRADGVVVAGSSPKLDETLFGRRQLLENLQKEYPQYEQQLKDLQKEIDGIEEEIENIDLRSLSDQGRVLLNDINNLEKQISQFEYEKNKSSEDIEKAQNDIRELVTESNKLDNQINELSEEIESKSQEKEDAEQQLKEFENSVQRLEEDYSELVTAHNNKNLELERLLGQKQNTENNISQAEKSKVNLTDLIGKREKNIESASEEITTIENIIDEGDAELSDLNDVKKKLISEEDEIKERLNEVKKEASKYEGELSSYRNERQEISDKIHEANIQINQIDLKLDNLSEHIREDYNIELELKEFDDLDTYPYEENKKEVNKYKEELKKLGPINLLAYSEYEEENERLEFLYKQRNDLVESEKDLVNTIKEINEAAESVFLETLEQIRVSFQKIFRTLFDPGDEAELKLEEGVDPLEAKIEIIAKPKGKRPTSIELLSGGEKTLTATALLFAIYLVKPSPFCILDEVDAPLDDANVDRFTRLLYEFSQNTQFILVTHNKRTMEAAENMYGVTMQNEGISKLVGVQFNEELEQFQES